jgi:glycosyltransferase involved in cell wall biosynthesis
MNSSKNQSGEHELPRIAHVEVGGSIGGSLLKLCDYLRHSDAHAFRRELIFYRRPPASEAMLDARCPTIETGLQVPPMSRPEAGRVRRKARAFLHGHARLRSWLSSMRGGCQLLASLPGTISLVRQFKRGQYDLIHCNNSFPFQVPTMLAAWLARKPLVCHFRTIRRLTRLELWLSRIPVVIVPICQIIADDLRRQGVRAPLEVCYDPWERPHASAESPGLLRKELLQDGTILVGTVSRLEDLKGIEDFLRAARLLSSRQPDARYVIVGDGSKAETLKRLAVEWGVGEQVRFVGFHKNVFDYCRAMDIFVCPSLMEGAQAVVLEAMMMRLPVVATRVGWAPELIRDGENGLLVNASEPESLALAIESLMAEPRRRQEVGARGEESVLHLCDPLTQAQKIDALFLHAIWPELKVKAASR